MSAVRPFHALPDQLRGRNLRDFPGQGLTIRPETQMIQHIGRMPGRRLGCQVAVHGTIGRDGQALHHAEFPQTDIQLHFDQVRPHLNPHRILQNRMRHALPREQQPAAQQQPPS